MTIDDFEKFCEWAAREFFPHLLPTHGKKLIRELLAIHRPK
jgi:hypothetical protein